MCATTPAFAQILISPGGGAAQQLPSSADINRTDPFKNPLEKPAASATTSIPESRLSNAIPEGIEGVTLKLKHIKIEGMSAFKADEMKDIYTPFLGKTIPLSKVWEFANSITERYRNEQYFLTRAYVPVQEIDNGSVTLRVVEGYIGKVTFNHPLKNNYIMRNQITRIKDRLPLKASQLESFMLRLNDFPGASFFGALKPMPNGPEGAIELVLKHTDNQNRGSIYFDNAGSRFLGPYQAGIRYEGSFIPTHKTALSAASALGSDELRSYSITHEIPLYPQWKLQLYGSHVNAKPGSNLKTFDIQSEYNELGVGLEYQPVRQYLENLTFNARIDGKNSKSDIFGDTELSRDRIRALRTSVKYDTADGLNGHNYFTLGYDRGLDIFASSQAGDINLSRAEAEPDFMVGSFSYARIQTLPNKWLLTAQSQGQYASKPLYSAEEFGYGGQTFGRAYDPSDIVGDHGIAGMIEVRYQGFKPWNEFTLAPYGFYDIGKVWNEDAGTQPVSGSSAGFGMYINHSTGINSSIGLAFPLTREANKPLYGNSNSPRINIQLSYGF